jgi:hypothetical protein
LGGHVAGWVGAFGAVPLIGLLALNWMWLMGFYNFLLGMALFALTLGFWWRWRERLDWRRAGLLTVLLVLGYFCHLFSLGGTVLGLGVLSLLTPGPGWWRRVGWTVLSGVPLLPLLLTYRNLAQQDHSPIQASWKGLTSVWSVREWLLRWQATETLQLGGRQYLPFGTTAAPWHLLLSPPVLAAGGIGLLLAVSACVVWRNWTAEGRAWVRAHRSWLVLTGLLFVGCAFTPDQLGDRHGGYLRQRLLLMALLTLLPWLRFAAVTRAARLGKGLLVGAFVLQILWVWDYALTTTRLAGEFLQIQQVFGQTQASEWFIGTMLLPAGRAAEGRGESGRGDEPDRYTARPLLHLDNWLGLSARTVVWNNYEATQYYFPVRHQTEAATLLARELDLLNKRSLPKSTANAEAYVRDWLSLLARAHGDMHTLVVWGTAPALEAQLWQWYLPEPVFAAGRVRVFQHR